jgi:hypothetical protein
VVTKRHGNVTGRITVAVDRFDDLPEVESRRAYDPSRCGGNLQSVAVGEPERVGTMASCDEPMRRPNGRTIASGVRQDR